MNLDNAKRYVLKHRGEKNNFLYRGVRNQIEEFVGIINQIYPSVFLIELEDGSIKSFSYNDIIMKNLKIMD